MWRSFEVIDLDKDFGTGASCRERIANWLNGHKCASAKEVLAHIEEDCAPTQYAITVTSCSIGYGLTVCCKVCNKTSDDLLGDVEW